MGANTSKSDRSKHEHGRLRRKIRLNPKSSNNTYCSVEGLTQSEECSSNKISDVVNDYDDENSDFCSDVDFESETEPYEMQTQPEVMRRSITETAGYGMNREPEVPPKLIRRLGKKAPSNYNELNTFVSNHLNLHEDSGIVGLRNLGNTCFMNAALQCLSNTIPLTDYFLGFNYETEINFQNFLGTGGQLVKSYADLIERIWDHNAKPQISPSDFKASLGRFAPQFEGFQQHDAMELLAFLLDGLHEDLNRVTKKAYVEDVEGDENSDCQKLAIKSWIAYLQRNMSIIVDLFQGQIRSKLSCQECGKESIKFESFMFLTLPISVDTKSIDDCLNLYCCEEILDEENKWHCPRCKKLVCATKKLDLWMLPPCLIINLKRFECKPNGRRTKLNQKIDLTVENWDLSKWLAAQKLNYPLKYGIYATINHHGDENSGHYTAYACNRKDDIWCEFNDSYASTMDNLDLAGLRQSSSAYVLFYNRIDSSTGQVEKEVSGGTPTIRRQSLGSPHLWPHHIKNDLRSSCRRRDFFINYMRQPSKCSNSSLVSTDIYKDEICGTSSRSIENLKCVIEGESCTSKSEIKGN